MASFSAFFLLHSSASVSLTTFFLMPCYLKFFNLILGYCTNLCTVRARATNLKVSGPRLKIYCSFKTTCFAKSGGGHGHPPLTGALILAYKLKHGTRSLEYFSFFLVEAKVR